MSTKVACAFWGLVLFLGGGVFSVWRVVEETFKAGQGLPYKLLAIILFVVAALWALLVLHTFVENYVELRWYRHLEEERRRDQENG